MTVNTTQTKTRPRQEQHRPKQHRPEQHRPEQGPERARPDRRAGIQPRRSASPGEVVLAYLRLQAHALQSLDPMVRADEVDAVHQIRVATRRLRATLRSFGQVTPRSDAERLARE